MPLRHLKLLQRFLMPSMSGMLAISTCLTSISVSGAETHNHQPTKKITLGATDWCPYTCDDNERAGYIVDIMKQVFLEHNYTLTVRFFPWNRAIAKVKAEQLDGLLTAVPSEAPELHFTTTPTDYYQMCFYTPKTDFWTFYGRTDDLKTIKLGVLSGYGYGEPLDSYIADPINAERIEKIAGEAPLLAMTRMLKFKRINALIEDKYVLKNLHLNHHNKNLEELREAGCLESHPFYLALSSHFEDYQSLISDLDHHFQTQDYEVLKFNTLNQYKLVKNSGLSRDKNSKPKAIIATN